MGISSVNVTKNFRQTATVWTTIPDGFGGYTFAPPELIKCRWEDKAELYYGRVSGKEEVSRAIVYVPKDLEVGDWIALGDFLDTADPVSVKGALPIRDFSSVPDLRNLVRVRKAVL